MFESILEIGKCIQRLFIGLSHLFDIGQCELLGTSDLYVLFMLRFSDHKYLLT